MSTDRREQDLGAFIVITINSGSTAQGALQSAGQPPQIKGFQVVPWPLFVKIGHGRWFMSFCVMGSQKLKPVSPTLSSQILSFAACPPYEPPWRRHQGSSTDCVAAWVFGALPCSGQGQTSSQSTCLLVLVLLTVLENSLAATKSIYWWQLNHALFKEVTVFPVGCSETGSPLCSVMRIIHTNTHEAGLLWSLPSVRGEEKKRKSYFLSTDVLSNRVISAKPERIPIPLSAEEDSTVICLA